jgi:hypothetical protein
MNVRFVGRYCRPEQVIVQVLEINDRYSKNLKKVMAAWEAENLEEPEQDERSSIDHSPLRHPANSSEQPAINSQSEVSSDPPVEPEPMPQQSNSTSDWVFSNEQGTDPSPAFDENSEQQ